MSSYLGISINPCTLLPIDWTNPVGSVLLSLSFSGNRENGFSHVSTVLLSSSLVAPSSSNDLLGHHFFLQVTCLALLLPPLFVCHQSVHYSQIFRNCCLPIAHSVFSPRSKSSFLGLLVSFSGNERVHSSSCKGELKICRSTIPCKLVCVCVLPLDTGRPRLHAFASHPFPTSRIFLSGLLEFC